MWFPSACGRFLVRSTCPRPALMGASLNTRPFLTALPSAPGVCTESFNSHGKKKYRTSGTKKLLSTTWMYGGKHMYAKFLKCLGGARVNCNMRQYSHVPPSHLAILVFLCHNLGIFIFPSPTLRIFPIYFGTPVFT